MIHTLSDKERAFIENAVHSYYDEIYYFLVRRCNSKDDAQDICQNTFVRFSSSVDSYRERRQLRAYLFKIAVNCCNEYYRKSREALPLDEALTFPSDPDFSPHSRAERRDEQSRVQACLASIPQHYKDVLILRYYSDLKPKEIAKILDIPVATVKTRLYRAKEMFEREWENEE